MGPVTRSRSAAPGIMGFDGEGSAPEDHHFPAEGFVDSRGPFGREAKWCVGHFFFFSFCFSSSAFVASR